MKKQSSPSLFRSPHLPIGFIITVSLVILTQAAVLLIDQPSAYWTDHEQASSWFVFQNLLINGPLFYAGIVIAYLALVILLLRKLNISYGLALASGLAFFHIGFSNASIQFRMISNIFVWLFFGLAHYALILTLVAMALVSTLPKRQNLLLRLRLNKPIVYVPFSLIWVSLLAFGIYFYARQPESSWKQIVPEHSPGPRASAAIAYDKDRQRAVLFGGVSGYKNKSTIYDTDVWEWDGEDWIQIQTTYGPPGRVEHAMVYDESRRVVLLFGGINQDGVLNDLWQWDGKEWTMLCPVCNPAQRHNHEMYFDNDRDKVIVYGGNNLEIGYHEAWSWDGEGWCSVYINSPAPETYGGAMIYDPRNQYAVGFLGESWGGTWIFKGDKWFKPKLANEPPIRSHPTLVYDPIHNQSVLFGGNNMSTRFNDAWIYRNGKWEQMMMDLSPPARTKHVAFYDLNRQSVIIYGGEYQRMDDYFSDMWELQLPEGDQQ